MSKAKRAGRHPAKRDERAARAGRAIPAELLVALGYGLSLFASGFEPTSPITPVVADDEFTSLLGAAFQAGHLAPYFVVAALCWAAPGASARRPAAWSCAAVALGAGLRAIGGGGGGPVELAVMGCLLEGAGFAFLALSWFSLLEALPLRRAAACLLAGSASAPCAFLALGALGVDAGSLAPAAAVACSVGSAACFGLAERGLRGERSEREEGVRGAGAQAGERGVSLPAALRRLAPSILCASLLVLVGPAVGFGAVNASVGDAARSAAANAGLLGSVAVCAASCRALRRPPGIVRSYLVLFPVVATALLLLALFSPRFSLAFLAVGYLSYNLTSLLMILASLEVARGEGPSAARGGAAWAVPGSKAAASSMGAAPGERLAWDVGAPGSAETAAGGEAARGLFSYGAMAGTVYLVGTLGAWVGSAASAALPGGAAPSALAFVALYAMSIAALAVSRRPRRPVGERETQGGAPVDMAEARARAAAGRYGLTEREAQILSYVAHGRDVPAIADRMGVSKDTVKSHLKSVHLKTGVHTRQELLDLLEGELPEPEEDGR